MEKVINGKLQKWKRSKMETGQEWKNDKIAKNVKIGEGQNGK